MDVIVSNYRELINRLEQEVYPNLKKSLNAILKEERGSLTPLLSNILSIIQKELHSLKTFEEKLIFPAILSLVDENEEKNDFAPDVSEIIKLTNRKEERLNKCVEKISELIKHEDAFAGDNDHEQLANDLHEFIQVFYKRFCEEKKEWKELLHGLQNDLIEQPEN